MFPVSFFGKDILTVVDPHRIEVGEGNPEHDGNQREEDRDGAVFNKIRNYDINREQQNSIKTNILCSLNLVMLRNV